MGIWINVEERLPEDDERYKGKKQFSVLVTTKNGCVSKLKRSKLTIYGKDMWHWGNSVTRSDIIAWMHLPEPYKKEVE